MFEVVWFASHAVAQRREHGIDVGLLRRPEISLPTNEKAATAAFDHVLHFGQLLTDGSSMITIFKTDRGI